MRTRSRLGASWTPKILGYWGFYPISLVVQIVATPSMYRGDTGGTGDFNALFAFNAFNARVTVSSFYLTVFNA